MGGSRPGKEKVIKKELVAEDWCFVCKDGGSVRICDYKQCLKSYHPSCVGKHDSFLHSEDHWTCNWHTCILCSRSSYCHCYTCAKAVCRLCLPTADFLQVRGKNGFCGHCLKLALLLEGNKDCDSDGEQVDFKDLETYEGLFKEYYLIIKENEGFELCHIYAAKDLEKARKNYKSGFGSLELDEDDDEDEEEISEYDGSDHEKPRKRILKSVNHSRLISNKKEFIGWGSRTLIEFLESTGKSTSEVLSQRDVTDIVNGYILENKLLHSKKRKMVVCDERLQPLFGRRMISKHRIYDLLEDHFTENHDESEEDDMGYDHNPVYKRQRKFDKEINSTKNEREHNVPRSVFASISVDNVKLVYLKRSLLYELLKHPETFEEKVIGCFVRVKSDPHDYCAKNSHHLMEVKGIKSASGGESNTDIVLCSSAFLKEVHISLLSDNDFSEPPAIQNVEVHRGFPAPCLSETYDSLSLSSSQEECADLRQKMLAGLLMKPTVVELQQKARVLHKDLTKHRINKELRLLQKLIDLANEKGRRRELFEYLEKRKRLQTPSEQARLLETFPIVSPEIPELSPNSEDSIDDVKNDDNSILQSASTVPRYRWEENRLSAEKDCCGHGFFPETKQPLLERSGSGESQRICIPDHEFKPLQPASEEKGEIFETCHFGEESHMSSEEIQYEQAKRKCQDASTVEVEFNGYENANDGKANNLITVNQKFDIPEGDKTCCILGPNEENDKNSVPGICTEEMARKVQESTPVAVIELLDDDKNGNNHEANNLIPPNQKIGIPDGDENEMHPKKAARKGQKSTPIGVIELLNDDEDAKRNNANSGTKDRKFNNLGSKTRHILGHSGKLENNSMPDLCSEETPYQSATRTSREPTPLEFINLISDDEENGNESNASSVSKDRKFNDLESETWCIRGPNGEREKCSMSMLKRWSEISPYAFKFKVWREEQKEENAIWLWEAINFVFSKQ